MTVTVLTVTITVCVAGATGWTGRPIAQAVLDAADLRLSSVVSRSHAGTNLRAAWQDDTVETIPVFGSVQQALDQIDVLVDYTSHDVVRENALAATTRGVSVVIGASGLSADDYADIDQAAADSGVGVIAAGNFSLTAAMAQAAALLVGRHLPYREIIDYAAAGNLTLQAVQPASWPNASAPYQTTA